MTTQPLLPAPITPTVIEQAYIEDSPSGLWPENQDSNFGLHRKVFCDRLFDVVSQLQTIFNEMFPDTSVVYLDKWEEEMGLTVAAPGRTLQQRQNAVISRSRRGAFTRAGRQQIVENFITATFGVAPAFGPGGIVLGSGVPLHSGISGLAGTYAIRENDPSKNPIDNPSYEADIVGTAVGGSGATSGRSTTQAKFGVGSLLLTATSTGGIWITQVMRSGTRIPVLPNTNYVFSSYHKQGSGTRTTALGIDFYTSGGAVIGTGVRQPATSLPSGDWVRKYIATTSPSNAASAVVYPVIANGGVVGDFIYTDGIQLEVGTTPTDWSDPAQRAFYYEVRILNTITVDDAALRRELDRITPAGYAYDITYTSTP